MSSRRRPREHLRPAAGASSSSSTSLGMSDRVRRQALTTPSSFARSIHSEAEGEGEGSAVVDRQKKQRPRFSWIEDDHDDDDGDDVTASSGWKSEKDRPDGEEASMSMGSDIISHATPARYGGHSSTANQVVGSSTENDRRQLLASLKQSTTGASATHAPSRSARKNQSQRRMQERACAELEQSPTVRHESATTRGSSSNASNAALSIIDFFQKSVIGDDLVDGVDRDENHDHNQPNNRLSKSKLTSGLSKTLSSFGRSLRQTLFLTSANAENVPDYEEGSDTIDYSNNNLAPHASFREAASEMDSIIYELDNHHRRQPSFRQYYNRQGVFRARILSLVLLAGVIIGVSVGIVKTRQRVPGGQGSQDSLSSQQEQVELEDDSRDEVDYAHPGLYDETATVSGLDVWDETIPATSEPRSERFLAMRERIYTSKVSSLENLDYDGSAQYLALQWLADNDEAALSPVDEFLIQRYALAVLYFSTPSHQQDNATDGGSWSSSTNWLTAKGHCSWSGVLCRRWNGLQVVQETYDGNGDVFSLNLTASNLQGRLPADTLLGLEDLRVLDLSSNLLEGTIPLEIGSLISLLDVDLSSNGLTGSIPPQVGALLHCRSINLASNYLSSTIPPSIGGLENLEVLSLYENSLTGDLETIDFQQMQRLEALYVDQNELHGELVDFPVSLVDLRLGSNNFHGHIDPLFHLTNLINLEVDSNAFSGTISPFIYQLQQLEVLAANSNFLSGTIPFMVERLRHLRVLYADNNELSGTIPSSLPPNLVELYLSKNTLEGGRPEGISQLHHLEKLILHENLLGSDPNAIPQSLGNISSLKKLYLHENSFVGEMPKKVCDLRYLNLMDFSSDCGGDPAEIECFCCTSCF